MGCVGNPAFDGMTWRLVLCFLSGARAEAWQFIVSFLSAAECAASTGLLKEFALPPSIFASKDVRPNVRPFTIFTEFMNKRPPPKSLRPRHKR